MAASPAVLRFYARVMHDGVPLLQALDEERQRTPPRPVMAKLPARHRFPDQLRRWRERYQVTQVQAAALFGISEGTWRRWEYGRYYPQKHLRTQVLQGLRQPPPPERSAPVGSLRSRILQVLARLPDQQAHYTVLAERLETSPKHVHAACRHMARDGRVEWVDEGVYALEQRNA